MDKCAGYAWQTGVLLERCIAMEKRREEIQDKFGSLPGRLLTSYIWFEINQISNISRRRHLSLQSHDARVELPCDGEEQFNKGCFGGGSNSPTWNDFFFDKMISIFNYVCIQGSVCYVFIHPHAYIYILNLDTYVSRRRHQCLGSQLNRFIKFLFSRKIRDWKTRGWCKYISC